jgi:hypothetical protein
MGTIEGGVANISFGYGSRHDGEESSLFICDRCWYAMKNFTVKTPIISTCFKKERHYSK